LIYIGINPEGHAGDLIKSTEKTSILAARIKLLMKLLTFENFLIQRIAIKNLF